MNQVLIDYYRCPEQDSEAHSSEYSASQPEGFFRFGTDLICFGRCQGALPCRDVTKALPHVTPNLANGTLKLGFDPAEVIKNLRQERYCHSDGNGNFLQRWTTRGYYLIRPLLNVAIRKRLQQLRLRGWNELQFPHWPVDHTVESLLQDLLRLTMIAQGRQDIPFIWFWPDNAAACSIITHDVETAAGRDFCSSLMDIDSQFGFKASFQIVPEKRYQVPTDFLHEIRKRGFEIAVHDLNHDGNLYCDREEFLRCAKKINDYGRKFGALGFRAAVLYRNQDWFSALDFNYDMSVPNVAHLDPQHGGCCTVMPYFVDNIVELPVTTTQDYTLFHILNNYTIELWKHQIEILLANHGLISFIIHPDYIIEDRARGVYVELLQYLSNLRNARKLWAALPSEVDRWWRDRQASRLVKSTSGWVIEGPAKDRGSIAYAHLSDDRVEYAISSHSLVNQNLVRT